MLYIVQLVNMAIPKAGFLFKSIPITLATVLFAVSVVWVLLTRKNRICSIPPIFWGFYGIVVVSTVIVTALNFHVIRPGNILYILVIIASPLAMLLSINTDNIHTAIRVTAAALCIVGLFSSIQWILGLKLSTIPGIVLALGDSWWNKPIALEGGRLLVKIPSTYQNGNLVASFCTIAIPLVLSWPNLQNRDRGLRLAGLVLGLTALFLSGSRSGLYPFLIIWMVICVIYLRIHHWEGFKYLMLLLMVLVMLMTTLGQSPGGYGSTYEFMTKRYIAQTIKDPTASGRTKQWTRASRQFMQINNNTPVSDSLARRILFGVNWKKTVRVEGLIGIGQRFGIIVMGGYVVLLGLVILWWAKKDIIVALGLLILVGQFTIDASFAQPPSLINYFFIGGLSCHAALKGLNESEDS